MRTRFVTIDALRGVACLWVVLYHVGAYAQMALWRGWGTLLDDTDDPLWARALAYASRLGFQGVSLFLVLSGFCLYLPVIARAEAGKERVQLLPFARARVLRIVPAYYASIGILWGLSRYWAPGRWMVFNAVEAWDVAVHLAFAHNLVPASLWTIDGVYWSLALEVQLYLVFPLLVLGARATHVAWVALGAVALSVGWPALIARVLPDLDGNAWTVIYESLPGRLGEFVTGMLAASLVVRGAPRFVRFVAWPLAFVFVPATYVVHVSRAVSFPIDKPLCALSFASIAYLLATGEGERTRWPTRALGHVGKVSFSLYLIHQPLLLATRPWVWEHPWTHVKLWLFTFGVGLPVLVLVATLFYAIFEAPFLPGGRVRKALMGDARGA